MACVMHHQRRVKSSQVLADLGESHLVESDGQSLSNPSGPRWIRTFRGQAPKRIESSIPWDRFYAAVASPHLLLQGGALSSSSFVTCHFHSPHVCCLHLSSRTFVRSYFRNPRSSRLSGFARATNNTGRKRIRAGRARRRGRAILFGGARSSLEARFYM